jgi:hypothetical protein
MVGRVVTLVALGLGLFCACGGDEFDSNGSNGQPSTCAGDELRCSDQCVRKDSPAFGCGIASCTPCDVPHAVPKCESGACAVDSCQNGYADCNAEPGCESDLNSPDTCGDCSIACQPGDVCDAGQCQSACSGGKANCEGTCADLQTDADHCGACDTECSQTANSLPVCAAGKCTLACTGSFLNCNGQVPDGCEVNPDVDPANCGACGTECPPGNICKGGECELNCGGGTTECGSFCVDLNTDEANCGECGKSCSGGQNCIGGVCQLNCGGGTVECNGACVLLSGDPNNCGTCGNACDVTENCNAGQCKPKCTVPVPTTLFSDNFTNNAKGWTLSGPWQIGATLVSTGHTYGNADPNKDAAGVTGGGVAGVALGGNVPLVQQQEFLYLTSPIIPTAGLPYLFLEFKRWLNTDWSPFMENRVEVYNGSVWVKVWESGGSPGILDNSWVTQGFEITPHANAQLRVRFGFAVPSTMAYVVSGWNVDDVKVSTLACN